MKLHATRLLCAASFNICLRRYGFCAASFSLKSALSKKKKRKKKIREVVRPWKRRIERVEFQRDSAVRLDYSEVIKTPPPRKRCRRAINLLAVVPLLKVCLCVHIVSLKRDNYTRQTQNTGSHHKTELNSIRKRH